jgi:hypothetical protein
VTLGAGRKVNRGFSQMRRIVILAAVCLLPAALLVTLALDAFSTASQMPVPARDALYQYLAYPNAQADDAVTVRSVSRAGQPYKFSRDLSEASYSSARFYGTDFRFDRQAMVGGGKPLPFPALEAYCVLLLGPGDAVSQVIVALHQDLYNADWIVHVPTAGAAGMIGCAMGPAN